MLVLQILLLRLRHVLVLSNSDNNWNIFALIKSLLNGILSDNISYPLAPASYPCCFNTQYKNRKVKESREQKFYEGQAVLFKSHFSKGPSLQKQCRCGFGGMQLKIQSNLVIIIMTAIYNHPNFNMKMIQFCLYLTNNERKGIF